MEPGTKFRGISHVVILVVYDASYNVITLIQLEIRSVMNLEVYYYELVVGSKMILAGHVL